MKKNTKQYQAINCYARLHGTAAGVRALLELHRACLEAIVAGLKPIVPAALLGTWALDEVTNRLVLPGFSLGFSQ